MGVQKSELQVWLEFAAQAFWPLTLIVLGMVFRSEIQGLIRRITSAKFGGSEVAFQPPSADTVPLGPQSAIKNIKPPQQDGFLGENEVRKYIANSGIIDASGEVIFRAIKIFATSNQETWIVVTKNRFICLLDNFKKSEKSQLIQWVENNQEQNTVRVREKNQSVGLVDINRRRNWLYSLHLWPDPDALQREIQGAATSAKA